MTDEVSWRPTASIATLQARARLLRAARAFFDQREILEVEVPLLQGGANLDRGVTPVAVPVDGSRRWLPTSPEHPLKRLLAAGSGDVWAQCPCARSAEIGHYHAPVFSMLEWYRLGWDHHQLAAETVALLDCLTGLGTQTQTVTYQAIMTAHAGIYPFDSSDAALRNALGDAADAARDRNEMLDLILSLQVQPALPSECWTVVIDWPPEQAAQARIIGNPPRAARFEVYRGPLELANGYHECTDGAELALRLSAEQGHPDRERLDIDRDLRFEAAMAAGLPDCSGVALGFDRVVMVATGAPDLRSVQAFGWDRA